MNLTTSQGLELNQTTHDGRPQIQASLSSVRKEPGQKPHVLVVDDEPLFGRILADACRRSGMQVTVCHSVEELAACKNWSFDVAVLDYDLGEDGAVTGVELATYLDDYVKQISCVLVSQSDRLRQKRWPDVIGTFVQKNSGTEAILAAIVKQLNVV